MWKVHINFDYSVMYIPHLHKCQADLHTALCDKGLGFCQFHKQSAMSIFKISLQIPLDSPQMLDFQMH